MGSPSLVCTLREMRVAQGITQTQLAAKVGISRQSLAAIEAQRHVPSTLVAMQLAHALACEVGDLFRFAHDAEIRAERAPGAPVSDRVRLASVAGRVVAIGVWDTQRADGCVVATHADGSVRVRTHTPAASWEQTLVVVGCAPLLGALVQRFSEWRDQSAVWVHANSAQALTWLAAGFAHLAGLHRSSDDDRDANQRAAAKLFAGTDVTLIHLTAWQQGILTAPNNPLRLTPDRIAEIGARWVWREAGSAARSVLDDLQVPGPQTLTAAHHEEVAQLVRLGVVDAGVAIEAVARTHALGFVPVRGEDFDVVVHPQAASLDATQRFLDLLSQPAVVSDLGGTSAYDLSRLGSMTVVRHPT